MKTGKVTSQLGRFAPGLPALIGYRRADFPNDLIAGLSVAAVAVPVAVAYAELAGFSPVIGLYSSILPLVAYALFGTSRQLIVGPDAAACALLAAAVAPMAGGDPERYLSLSIALTGLAGVFCIGASFLKLGALADFLSKPILIGFMNGMSLHILAGQIHKLLGFPITAPAIVPKLVEVAGKIEQTHLPTLAVGLLSFGVLLGSARLIPRIPPALVALVVGSVAVAWFGLDARGVAVLGAIPAGLPTFRLQHVSPGLLDELVGAAAGIAMVSFSSMMLTARSFASKNRYPIDADREFAALGAANIAASLSQGFVVSGTDSRTAVNDSSGGRTQVAGLIAAVAIAAVLLFLTGPLRYVPVPALGAVLIMASVSLLDLRTPVRLYRLNRREFVLSIIAALGVIWVGAVKAIVVVVILALLQFVRATLRPSVETLGHVEGLPGFHAIDRYESARTHPGLVLFRFNAPLVFFNAPYFKQQAEAAIGAAGPDLKWFVLDALPITQVDITGIYELEDLKQTLQARGAELVVAGPLTDRRDRRTPGGLLKSELGVRYFPTLGQAVKACVGPSATDDDEDTH